MIARRVVNGERVWVIDRRFRTADGREERYRRAAQVQLREAADAEERRICDHFAKHGTIADLLKAQPAKPEPEAPRVWTWDDAVEHYKRAELHRLKPSTRRGYEGALGRAILKKWNGKPLIEITYQAIKAWDGEMCLKLPKPGSRLNYHNVLRSVLRSVGPEGDEPGLMLERLPAFPPLPKPDKKVIEIPDDHDIDAIMSEQVPKYCSPRAIRRAQLGFALAIWGGMRAGEVRALRRKDVDVVNHVITVRRSICAGEETTTKGRAERVIPIAPLLWERLEHRLAELKDDEAHVCVNAKGQPWGDYGLYQAFVRACARLQIKGRRYHACRHYFATALLEGGSDVVTVQHLLGHQDLTTTQRYAHYLDKRGLAAVSVFARKPIAAE